MRTIARLLLWAALAGCGALPDREAVSATASENTGAAPSASVVPIIVEHWGHAAATPAAPPSANPAAAPEKPVATSEKPASGAPATSAEATALPTAPTTTAPRRRALP